LKDRIYLGKKGWISKKKRRCFRREVLTCLIAKGEGGAEIIVKGGSSFLGEKKKRREPERYCPSGKEKKARDRLGGGRILSAETRREKFE